MVNRIELMSPDYSILVATIQAERGMAFEMGETVRSRYEEQQEMKSRVEGKVSQERNNGNGGLEYQDDDVGEGFRFNLGFLNSSAVRYTSSME